MLIYKTFFGRDLTFRRRDINEKNTKETIKKLTSGDLQITLGVLSGRF